jgi:hypothetical protein
MAKITGGPHRGHAAGDTDIEKQASQLASDVKYKVKKQLSGATHMNPAQVAKAYEAQLAKSPAPGAVKALAKKKLMGAPKPAVRKEEFDNSVELATESVANAMYKVFVEKKEVNVDEQVKELKEAYSKVNRKGERLYHIIVTDKKTGNSYTRDATREKIAELRANPNIASVEMSERKLDSEKETTKGENTASVKSGKGLKDYDGDGKVESGAKEYRGAVHNAIQRRKGGTPDGQDTSNVKEAVQGGSAPNLPAGVVKFVDELPQRIQKTLGGAKTKPTKPVKEEFLGELNGEANNPDANEKEIDVMKGKNKVVISPEVPGSGKKSSSFMQVAHYDMLGNPLSESEIVLNRMLQEKKLTPAEKAKKEEIVKSLKPKYGKTSKTYAIATSVAKKVAEETVAQADKKAKKEQDEMDPRSIPTAVNLAKNKLRAMGLKCSYEPEGEKIDEVAPLVVAGGLAAAAAAPYLLKKFAKPAADKAIAKQRSTQPGDYQVPARQGGLGAITARMRTGGIPKDYQQNSYELEGEVLDERRREDKGTPRSPRNRAVEMVRGMNKQGMMTRSGKTIAQHESERGVSEKDRPQKPEQTTADRLAAKKQRAAAEVAGRERAEREEQRRRRLA